MEGKRPENYSKRGSRLGWGIKNFIPLLEKMDANVKARIILVDNDAPLERQAEEVAKHVNALKGQRNCKKVHILGHSKCGTMNVAMLKYLSDSNLDKLNIMSYSAPYLGTIFASPKAFEKRLEEVVGEAEEKLLKQVARTLKGLEPKANSIVAKGALAFLVEVYKRSFGNSHMELDIAEGREGIYPEQMKRYDEEYIRGMFDDTRTLEMLRKSTFYKYYYHINKTNIR